jgi:hypothetical protein
LRSVPVTPPTWSVVALVRQARNAPQSYGAIMIKLGRLCVSVQIIAAATTMQACSSSSNSPGTAAGNHPWPAKAERVAQNGDASDIHVVRTINKPFDGCSRPNTFGWTSADGQQLAADELAWFIAHTPSDPNCSAFLYLFHDASQTNRSGFNAGAVIYDGGLLTVSVGTPVNGPTYEFKVP